MQIAMQIAKVKAWVDARTETPVPYINVFWDDSLGQNLKTGYTRPTDLAPGFVRIGGTGSGNPDAFDTSRVTRAYARHVLENVNGVITSRFQDDLNADSDAPNAFAEGTTMPNPEISDPAVLDEVTRFLRALNAATANGDGPG